jgi:hypothetical protein
MSSCGSPGGEILGVKELQTFLIRVRTGRVGKLAKWLTAGKRLTTRHGSCIRLQTDQPFIAGIAKFTGVVHLAPGARAVGNAPPASLVGDTKLIVWAILKQRVADDKAEIENPFSGDVTRTTTWAHGCVQRAGAHFDTAPFPAHRSLNAVVDAIAFRRAGLSRLPISGDCYASVRVKSGAIDGCISNAFLAIRAVLGENITLDDRHVVIAIRLAAIAARTAPRETSRC